MTRRRLVLAVVASSAVAVVGLSVAVGVAATRDSRSGDGDAPRYEDGSAGAWLGVLAESSTEPDGARILHVVSESPAADAGLAPGDVITALDGDAVADRDALRDAVREREPGDEVTLTVIKPGEDDTTEAGVTLGERPGRGPFGGPGRFLPRALDELFPDGFGRFLDGSFRYEETDGNIVEVAAVAGAIIEISDSQITIETNAGDTQASDLTSEAHVPGGLEAGDQVIVITVDGVVRAVIAPGHFPGIPLPHFDLEGSGLPFCDEDETSAPRFEDLREQLCDGEFKLPEFRSICDGEWRGSIPPGACDDLEECADDGWFGYAPDEEWDSSAFCTMFPGIRIDPSGPSFFCEGDGNFFAPNERWEGFVDSVCNGTLDIDPEGICADGGWLDYFEVDEDDAEYICSLPFVPPGRLGNFCEGGPFPGFLPGLYDEQRMREELCGDH
jgi:hypothetical protein